MIRLSVRLAAGGGREQWVRLGVAAVGVGIGVVLLLLAAAFYGGIHAHEARMAWTNTSAHNDRPGQDESRTDPLLWRSRVDSYAGQDIVRVDVAALGPHAPVPPGLAHLPGPGEMAVSPALARLLREVPAGQLADRFPAHVTAIVGDAALQDRGELVAVVGYPPQQLRGQAAVDEVRSIETRPTSVSLTRFGRVVVGLGAAALVMPILVLIGTSTRLSAARREQRFAAMRLVGATPGQVRTVAVVETILGAIAGTLVGFLVFDLVRPSAARVNLDGAPFLPSDLRLPWSTAVAVAVGVPVLAAVAAILSLRRVQVSPLGVGRRSTPPRLTWRRLIPLVGSAALFAASLPTLIAAPGDGPLWLIASAATMLVAGIVIAGPWLTVAVGRLLRAASGRVPAMLAGYRLTDDPAAGFRSISGLVLAVFLVTGASMATAISTTPKAGADQVLIPRDAVGVEFLFRGTVPPSADRSAALVSRLRATHGVTGVLDLHWATAAPPADDASRLPTLTRCAALRATGMAACPDPAAVVQVDARLLGNGIVRGVDPTTAAVPPERLPVLGLLVTTDGRSSTLEGVRTAIESAVPEAAWLPWTSAEVKGRMNHQRDQINHISDLVLLAALLIAGLSLAVSLAGGLIERKRPFALLRLSGMRPADLHRVLLVETTAPLVVVALASAGLGIAVISYMAWVSKVPWRPPDPSYWWMLGGGLTLACALALSITAPLLARLTSLETARFE